MNLLGQTPIELVTTVASLLCFAAWVYLIGLHGGFWRSLPVLDVHASPSAAKLAVIVPARNESENIRQSINSLLAQDYPGALSIILVDDESTDSTAEIASSLGAGDGLTILPGAPLPPGWSGKLWAVQQALAHPKAKGAAFLLLTDADIEHGAGHPSALVAKAEADGLDMVSEMVRLRCVTAAERALIPTFVFFFQMLYPFAWVADPKRRLAGAAGGTMLVRRTAMDRVHGVTGIRGRLIDDCALAQQIKSTDGTIWLGHAESTKSIRPYERWRDAWNMIARTAYEQLHHSPLMLLGCMTGMAIVFCTPPLLSLFALGWPRVLGILSWLMMAMALQPTLRRYRRSPAWGVLLPAISMFYLCATVASALRHHAGRGGEWKSRVYAEPPGA
jgi:hopene-associated glycosyltransferase HpnB